jgi:cytochrome c5
MTRKHLYFLVCLLGIFWGASSRVRLQAAPQQAAAPQHAIQAKEVVDKYCITCHNQRMKAAGLVLDDLDVAKAPEDAQTWEKVIRKVQGGMMPPVGAPRPDKAALDRLVTHLVSSIDSAAAARPNPGRTVLHRLNRAEYGNAIRDLFGLEIDITGHLPPDYEAFGFDNIADVLGVSPSLMERYLSAAWKITDLAIGSPKISPTLETFRVRGDLSQHDHVEGLPIGTRGGILIEHNFPLDGEYVIRPKLYRETVNIVRGLETPHDVEITFDGDRVHLERIGGGEDEREAYLNPTSGGDLIEKRLEKRLAVKAGPHTVAVAFLKKSSAPTVELLEPFQRERIDPITPVGIPEIDKVTVEGPFNVSGSGDSPSRRRILACTPARESEASACARKILSSLARKAYRRPATEAEMSRLMSFYEKARDNGETFDLGVQQSLVFMLVSPQFLFRFELDPANVAAGSIYRISDLELASRLSFFIWSSIPDDQLLNLAVQGRLKNASVLEQQVKRMLADERARALGSNFAGQWLYLRNLRSLSPDEDVFPDFDHNLRSALQRETEMLFESVVLEDRPVVDLLNANYTFINERLARHYRIPNVYGNQFRRVTVTDENRKGLLGHGSILALTSYANRTSPVNRGKYVLTNILGTPPPPPPDNVPPLDERPGRALSMRERMEEHRRNPACSGCHKLMDPIGLALENFDGIGRWRTTDGGVKIESSDTLFDGAKVEGPVGLRQAVSSRPEQFARTITEMLLTYGLGRGIEHYDMPVVRSVLKDAARDNYRFSSLVLGIVKSQPFQMKVKSLEESETSTVADNRKQ